MKKYISYLLLAAVLAAGFAIGWTYLKENLRKSQGK